MFRRIRWQKPPKMVVFKPDRVKKCCKVKVSVIVLNYNSSSDSRKCIGFLKKQKGVEQEIVVVDNCSREDDREVVERICKEQGCTFIANHENRGYSAGNNIGLRYAADKGYEYALIANPDMEFPQDYYLKKLVEIMIDDPTIAVCASDIVNTNGVHQNPMREMTYWEEFLWPLTAFKNRKNDMWFIEDYTKSSYCEKISGCCFMIRISFLQKIDFLDEGTFLYSEEPILAKQVYNEGMRTYYYAEAQALHRHIKSEKGNAKIRMQLLFQSRDYYLSKYSGYSPLQLFLLKLSKKIQSLLSDIIIK